MIVLRDYEDFHNTHRPHLQNKSDTQNDLER